MYVRAGVTTQKLHSCQLWHLVHFDVRGFWWGCRDTLCALYYQLSGAALGKASIKGVREIWGGEEVPLCGDISQPSPPSTWQLAPRPWDGVQHVPPQLGRGSTSTAFFSSFQAQRTPSPLRNHEFCMPYLQKGPQPQFFLGESKAQRAWDKLVLLCY